MMVRLPAVGTLLRLGPDSHPVLTVRVTAPVARCASCRARIIWTETHRGRRMPVDARLDPALGWVTHFATCPQARAWSRAGGRGRQ